MAKWSNIDNNVNSVNYRMHCASDQCGLSMCNILSGKLHITTLHNGTDRHSYTFEDEDMLFIISQYIKSLSPNDRDEIIKFLSQF